MGLSFRMVSISSSIHLISIFSPFSFPLGMSDIDRYIMIWNILCFAHGLKMALHSLYVAKKSPVVLGYFN